MIQLRVTWSPDGTVVERVENGSVASTATYASNDQALAGIEIALASLERAYLFPGMTDVQIETEMLARGIEQALARKSCRRAESQNE